MVDNNQADNNQGLGQILAVNQTVALHMEDGSMDWRVVTHEGKTLMELVQAVADEKGMAVTGYRFGRVVEGVDFS